MAVNFDALDLSEAEARVYQKILVSGQLNRGEIATSVGLGLNQLPQILDQLKAKNLIREVPGLVYQYAALLPLGSTKEQLEAAVAEVEVLSREIETTSQTAQDNLRQNLEQSKQQLEQEIQQEITTLNNQIAGVKEQVNQEKAGTQQNMAAQMQQNNETVEQQIKGANQQISIKASGFRGDAVGRISSQKDVVDRRAQQAMEAQAPIKEQFEAELSAIDLSGAGQVRPESEDGTPTQESQGYQSLAQMDEQIQQIIGTIHNQFNTQVETIRAKNQEFQDETITIFNQTQAGLDQNLARQDEMLGQLNSNIAQQTAQNKQALGEVVRTQKETIQSLSQQAEALNSKTEASLDQLNNTFISSADQIGGDLKAFVQTTEQNLSQQSSTFENEVQALVNQKAEHIKSTLQNQIQQFMEQTTAQLDGMTQDITTSLQAKTQELGTQRAEQRQQVEAGIASQTTTVKNSYQGLVEQHKQENQNQTNSMKQELENLLQQSEATLQSRMEEIDTIHAQLSSTASSSTTEFNSWKERVRDTIAQFQNNQAEVYGNSIRQTLETMGEELDSQKAQLEQLATSTHTQLKESLNALQEKLLNRFSSSVDQIIQQYSSFISENQQSTQETLDLLKQDTERVEQDILSSMQEIITKVDSDFKQLTSTLQGAIEQFTNTAYDKVLNQMAEVEKISTTTLSSVERLSNSGTELQLNVVDQTFNEYNSKFRQSTAKVSDRALSLAQLLDNLFQMQQSTETPALKTTHIVGKDSIINYMAEMIGRVKSKITILAPHTNMINDDQVLALPMTAQVTIVSEIDETSDRDWIEKMHGAKANVTLRTLTAQGFGAKLPDFIGCEREGEEIIVGTMDEGNNEYVAIASNSENFVRIFGSQIISEYARGRSKQLQK